MDVIRKTRNGPKTLVARSYDYTGFDSMRRSMQDVIEAETSVVLMDAAKSILKNLDVITIAVPDPRRPKDEKKAETEKKEDTAATKARGTKQPASS